MKVVYILLREYFDFRSCPRLEIVNVFSNKELADKRIEYLESLPATTDNFYTDERRIEEE